MPDFSDKLYKAENNIRKQYGQPIQAASDSVANAVEQIPSAAVTAAHNFVNGAPQAPAPHQWTPEEENLKQQALAAQADYQVAQKAAFDKNIASDVAAQNEAEQASKDVELHKDEYKPYTGSGGYADGGEVDNFDPDAFLAKQAPQGQAQAPQAEDTSGFDPDAFLGTLDEAEYGTPGQQAISGVEGALQGIAGPLAPAIEKGLGVSDQAILGRQKTNPVAHGVGEAVGLGAGLLTGTGEASVMTKAGELAAGAAGLAEPANLVAKVGSSAVKQAAEMMVMQGSDEASKMILNDPNSSAESAIANIGLAGALGAGTGAFVTGAISPLWDATVGPHVEKYLSGVKSYLNGEGISTPDSITDAAKTLGIDLAPEMKAGMSGDPKAGEIFSELRAKEHKGIQESIKKLETDVHDSIANSIGQDPEAVANYSEAEGGKNAMDAFKREYKSKYQPIADEFEAVTKPFESAAVPQAQINDLADKVTLISQKNGYLGADIPQDKLVQSVLNRIPKIQTVQDLSKLNTIIDNIAGDDLVLRKAGRDLKQLVMGTQQDALGHAIQDKAPELFGRYVNARSAYAGLASMSRRASDELGLGSRFEGPGTFLAKLDAKRSPEQFLRRLSPKGNADILPFLQQNFPETLEHVRDNELKQLLKPAAMRAKEGQSYNIKTLTNAIEKGLAGQPERLKFVLPEQALNSIRSGALLLDAVPKPRVNGVANWMSNLMDKVPRSALAFAGMLNSHNPFETSTLGFMAGHMFKLLSKDAPEAIKLAHLKFLASDQPVNAAGFKSMVDFLHNAVKGESLLTKTAGNVFKAGAMSTASNIMTQNEKLDKVVENYKENPVQFTKMTQGHTGHYMPDHQTALSENVTKSVGYLANLKPEAQRNGPLDRPIEPTAQQKSRYQSALTIANAPHSILQRVKDGTVRLTDLQDLKNLYPNLYPKMCQQVSNAMITAHSKDQPIPYKTRIGLSLFLGQPVDSSMTPSSIMAAQPAPPQQHQGSMGKPKRGTTTLGKSNKQYMTPGQAAESDRSTRD